MQTTTQRPARAKKQTAAPFSASAAKLIEQIRAEAREALLRALSAKDAVIVLHGFDAKTKRIEFYSQNIEIYDATGNSISLRRHFTEPEAWVGHSHMAGYWHPARWYGDQTLLDLNGRKWQCDIGVMVCDDFGNLVQVAA